MLSHKVEELVWYSEKKNCEVCYIWIKCSMELLDKKLVSSPE